MDRININAEAKRDPTQTTTLRNKFAAQFYKRFRNIKGLVRRGVEEKDALGLGQKAPNDGSVFDINVNQRELRRFEFATSDEKSEKFMQWLNNRVEEDVLEIKEGQSIANVDDRWTDKWIQRAYSKGLINAEKRLRQAGIDIGDTASIDVTLRQPVHADTLNQVFSRTFRELDGITNVMGQQINRELADGIAQGLNPRDVAENINDRVDKIGITRSRTLARTETIRAYNDATLNRYEQFGVEAVGARVEWLTAGDNRVCPICQGLEGTFHPIKEARGRIPVHPRCRCTWVPLKSNVAPNSINSQILLNKIDDHKVKHFPEWLKINN